MSDPLYRDFERLVEITIMGKAFQVPEKNTVLRVFQYVSPETIPYGRFCWNQECQLCKIGCRIGGQADDKVKQVLACKLIVAEGLDITALSDELRYCLSGILKPPEPRPAYD